jgi:hypothetical protein
MTENLRPNDGLNGLSNGVHVNGNIPVMPGNPTQSNDFNTEAARAQIAAIKADENAKVWFRFFDDSPAEDQAKAAKKFGTLDECLPVIKAKQAEGCGVFFVVNDGGNKDAEITRVRALFVDGDDLPVPGDDDWHVEPDVVTNRDESHWQAFWRIKPGMPLDDFKTAQKRLATYYKTDAKVCNLARVMRLAGSVHLKDPNTPRRVTLRKCEDFPSSPWPEIITADLPAVPVAKELEAAKAPEGVELVELGDAPIELVTKARCILKGDLDGNGPPIDGQGSDERTYKMAARLGELGRDGKALSGDAIVELMHEHWAPHFDADWIETKLSNAQNYAKNDVGSIPVVTTAQKYADHMTPELIAASKAEHAVQQEQARQMDATRPEQGDPFELLDIDELRKIPQPTPIIPGLLYSGQNVAIVAVMKAGKSFTALDIALSIATETRSLVVVTI